MWSDLAPLPGDDEGATVNTAGVLTPTERAAVEQAAAITGMSNSQVIRVAVRRLMRTLPTETQAEKA